MNKLKTYLFFSFVSIILSSCNRNDFDTAESGIRFKYLKKSKKIVLPSEGDVVFVHYSILNHNDSLVYSTYQNNAEERLPIYPQTHKGGDIFDAFKIMSEGDSMAFLISADSFYSKTKGVDELPENVEKGTDLKFVIKLNKFMTTKEYEKFLVEEKVQKWKEEVKDMDAFFKQKGWQDQRQENGVRYFINQPSQGKKPSEGDWVEFHYVGKVLKTQAEFVNSYLMGQAASFKYGDPEIKPAVINQIIGLMKEGEKATFLIPFDHGFQDKKVGNIIPPYSTLIYEINLLKVKEDE